VLPLGLVCFTTSATVVFRDNDIDLIIKLRTEPENEIRKSRIYICGERYVERRGQTTEQNFHTEMEYKNNKIKSSKTLLE
jgi:hypothetical protein